MNLVPLIATFTCFFSVGSFPLSSLNRVLLLIKPSDSRLIYEITIQSEYSFILYFKLVFSSISKD